MSSSILSAVSNRYYYTYRCRSCRHTSAWSASGCPMFRGQSLWSGRGWPPPGVPTRCAADADGAKPAHRNRREITVYMRWYTNNGSNTAMMGTYLNIFSMWHFNIVIKNASFNSRISQSLQLLYSPCQFSYFVYPYIYIYCARGVIGIHIVLYYRYNKCSRKKIQTIFRIRYIGRAPNIQVPRMNDVKSRPRYHSRYFCICRRTVIGALWLDTTFWIFVGNDIIVSSVGSHSV